VSLMRRSGSLRTELYDEIEVCGEGEGEGRGGEERRGEIGEGQPVPSCSP
jgi:hypothetical protein